jgi:hypothetical protein
MARTRKTVDEQIAEAARMAQDNLAQILAARNAEVQARGDMSNECIDSDCGTRWIRFHVAFRDAMHSRDVAELRGNLVDFAATTTAWIDAIDRETARDG